MLKRTFESVLNQDYPNIIKIIITDDGDDENTKKFIEENQKKDSRIIYVKNTKYKKGAVGNKQNGIDIAKGELLVLIDDDDILLPGAISSLVNVYLENNRKYQIVFCNCLRSDNGKFSGKHYGKNEEVKYEDFLCGKYEGEYFGVNESWVLKENKVDDKFPEMESITSLLLWKKYNINGYYVHKALRIYTVHPGQITQNYERNREKAQKTFESYKMYLKVYGEDLKNLCVNKYVYLLQLTSYLAKISGNYRHAIEYAKEAFKYKKNLFSLFWLTLSYIPIPAKLLIFIKNLRKKTREKFFT